MPHLGGEPARYCAFENILAERIADWLPDRIILEAPLPIFAMNNEGSARQQLGLRAFALSEAYRAAISITEIDVLTVRKDVLGQSRFAKDAVKREVVRWCLKRGIRVPDHNAGDAVLLWFWLAGRLRGAAPVAGPLFREISR